MGNKIFGNQTELSQTENKTNSRLMQTAGEKIQRMSAENNNKQCEYIRKENCI